MPAEQFTAVAPPPRLRRLSHSMMNGASLDEVARAVVVASKTCPDIYVERRGDLFRWSFPAGSAYPLLRLTAQFLQVDHRTLLLPFRALPDGPTVAWREDLDCAPDAWAAMEIEPQSTARQITAAVRRFLR